MLKFTFYVLFTSVAVGLNTARFNEVVSKIEKSVLEYRDFMESLYLEKRCDEISLMECQAANYDECFAALPNPTCPFGPEFSIPSCGGGEGCSGFVDFTKSVYSIAPGTVESDAHVIESVCFSRFMDEWLIQRSERDRAVWDEIGIEPQATFFGSTTGAFRIYPGRRSKSCGVYDPRLRPWYVASSSGPKNIILVLDKSGSMQGSRMSLMKEAAIRVIETLTISDRVAIVAFDETVKVIADEGMYLYQASNASKAILVDAIEKLEAKGATNIYDALDSAFDVLNQSKKKEFAVPCNSAILFLTDGEMTHPEGITPENVSELVSRRLNESSTELEKPVLFFSYSVSEAENVHTLPKQLACSHEFGVWSRIDSDDKIVEALSSYYHLFALNLGLEENADFVAWAEPYVYSTGDTLGTTASVPIYDRSKSPPLLIGVVAMDVPFEALQRALETDDIAKAIGTVALRSVAVCPTLGLTQCELDSYRAASGGEESRCLQDLCSADDLVETIATQCTDSSKYPDNLRANSDNKDLSYEKGVCCGVCLRGNKEDDGLSKMVIVGIAVVGGVAVFATVLIIYFCLKRSGGQVVVVKEAVAVEIIATRDNPPATAPDWKPSP